MRLLGELILGLLDTGLLARVKHSLFLAIHFVSCLFIIIIGWSVSSITVINIPGMFLRSCKNEVLEASGTGNVCNYRTQELCMLMSESGDPHFAVLLYCPLLVGIGI